MTAVTPAGAPYARPAQSEAYSVTTVLLLIAGGFLLPVVGWFAGVVMLWAGERWSTGAKWLGTLAWPAVVVVPVLVMVPIGLTTHGGGHATIVVGVVVGLLAAVAFLPWVFVHLLRAARR